MRNMEKMCLIVKEISMQKNHTGLKIGLIVFIQNVIS